MASTVLANLVGMTVSGAPGTGTITLGSALPGFLTPLQSGVVDQQLVVYEAIDGSNKEIGTATYNASGTTLTGRSVTNSTNSNGLVSLSSATIIYFSTRAQDILNKTGDTLTGALNWATPVTLASASTVNIGAAASNYVKVTGTTTITAFDTVAAGAERIVEFGDALTLTNNATSLILPGGANIATAAGDVAIFISEGSGNWRCESYSFAAALPVLTNANAAASDVLAGSSTAKFVTPSSLLGAGAMTAITVSSHSFTPNLANGLNFTVALENGQTDTLANPTNGVAGDSGVIVITQNGTGASTLAFGNNWNFAGGTVPTASTTLGAIDILAYFYDGSKYYGNYTKGWAT